MAKKTKKIKAKTKKPAKTKKTTAKKSSTKKLAAKKTTKKKVVAKKAAPKKLATKKTATKKVATKTATPKKVTAPKPTLPVSPITLQTGDAAPELEVKDQNGNTVTLASLNGKKVVLYFYPKDLTPGCTVEACDFRDSFNRLKSMDVEVLGVSMDDEQLHKKFIETHNLNFNLLSDTEGKLCYNYGVLKEKNMYGKKYVGIARTTFIVKDGKILKVYPQVKVEGHVQEVINDLTNL